MRASHHTAWCVMNKVLRDIGLRPYAGPFDWALRQQDSGIIDLAILNSMIEMT